MGTSIYLGSMTADNPFNMYDQFQYKHDMHELPDHVSNRHHF